MSKTKYIRVPVEDNEEKTLEAKAKQVGLNVAQYLKLTGMTTTKITSNS